jgi:hypothetical protein
VQGFAAASLGSLVDNVVVDERRRMEKLDRLRAGDQRHRLATNGAPRGEHKQGAQHLAAGYVVDQRRIDIVVAQPVEHPASAELEFGCVGGEDDRDIRRHIASS